MVGHEQTIEREQACQQCAEPEDRRAEPRQQRQIGPECERHQHYHGEKEQHADQRPAADPQRDLDVSCDQRSEGSHDAPSIRNSLASSPSGVWVAATISPPRARWSRINLANILCPAASSALVGSSSSQIGRRTVSSRAIESRRRCPADRNAAGYSPAWSSPTAARLILASKTLPPRKSTQNARFSITLKAD